MSTEQYDETGNYIPSTIYESYLSKFITENPSFYQTVYEKINRSIAKFIKENSGREFDRYVYSIFSEHSRYFPEHDDIEKILSGKFNVQAHDRFHKLFFEVLFPKGICGHFLKKDSNKVYKLSELAQFTIHANSQLQESLKKVLRPAKYFSKLGRSREDLGENDSKLTRKLGITSIEHTPVDLINYYEEVYQSAQSIYKRKYDGNFSQWLQKRNLPYVAGPSGSLQIIFCGIIQLDTFTSLELKKYIMGMAGAMVSRGHHSFAEVMIAAKSLGFYFKKGNDRAFYEQLLTKEVLDSSEYKKFLEEAPCVNIISENCLVNS